MPRFPEDAVKVALNDDDTRIGSPVQDPTPPPQKPGLIKRIYNYVVGDTFVGTNTPLRRTTEIPRITDEDSSAAMASSAMASSKPYVTEPTQLTIEELEKKYSWMTPEEFDEKMLEISRGRRARRLSAMQGQAGTDIRKPVLPPIAASAVHESDDKSDDSDDDSDDEFEEVPRKPMSGGGRVVIGNAALATIVVVMALFQS
jgi:hypothetical protein